MKRAIENKVVFKIAFLDVLFLFLIGLSASAAQGVPEGGLRCHADAQFLRQR